MERARKRRLVLGVEITEFRMINNIMRILYDKSRINHSDHKFAAINFLKNLLEIAFGNVVISLFKDHAVNCFFLLGTIDQPFYYEEGNDVRNRNARFFRINFFLYSLIFIRRMNLKYDFRLFCPFAIWILLQCELVDFLSFV